MPFRLILIFLALITSLHAKSLKPKWELGVVAIFQNEARFLKEWIEFHKLVGVEHFWLYNNASKDDYKKVLEPYIKSGLVELIEWPKTSDNVVEWNNIQSAAYKNAIKKAQGRVFWLAIIDTDEFLFSPTLTPVPEVLKQYKGKGGVAVNWLMFGTSGVKTVPEGGLLTEFLTLRGPMDYPANIHVKTIANPFFVKDVNNPHFVIYQDGFDSVTPSGIAFKGPFSPSIEHDLLRINHYWPRDEDFLYAQKIHRRISWGSAIQDILDKVEALNQYPDEAILPYVPLLKKAMEATK
ncbi:MAG: glycosyltransferase family 92 protein [Chlamydiia bacterium]|nr:glycosyltransferase family 92 protein [Chlamydiia bacterium]